MAPEDLGKYDRTDKIYEGICKTAVGSIDKVEMLFLSTNLNLVSERIEYSETEGIPEIVQNVMKELVKDPNAREHIFPPSITNKEELEEFINDREQHSEPKNRSFIDFVCLAIRSGIMGQAKDLLYMNYVRENLVRPVKDALSEFKKVLNIEHEENLERQGVAKLREELEAVRDNEGFYDLVFREVASHSSMDTFCYFFRNLGFTDTAGKEVRKIMEKMIDENFLPQKRRIFELIDEKRNAGKKIGRKRKETHEFVGALGVNMDGKAAPAMADELTAEPAVKEAANISSDEEGKRIRTLAGVTIPVPSDITPGEGESSDDLDDFEGGDTEVDMQMQEHESTEPKPEPESASDTDPDQEPASDTDPDPEPASDRVPDLEPAAYPDSDPEPASDLAPKSIPESMYIGHAASMDFGPDDKEAKQIIEEQDPETRYQRLRSWVADRPRVVIGVVLALTLSILGTTGYIVFRRKGNKSQKDKYKIASKTTNEDSAKRIVMGSVEKSDPMKPPMKPPMKSPMKEPMREPMQAPVKTPMKAPTKVPSTIKKADRDLIGPRPIKRIKPKETKEKLEYKRYFKSGRYGLNWRDLMKGSSPDVPASLVDRNGTPPKLFNLTGEADKEHHRDVNNGSNWYKEKLLAAHALDGLEKYIDSAQFPNSQRNFAIIKVLISKPEYCTFRGLRRMIRDGHANHDEIFGENGVLNFILAFQRSVSPLVKKGIKYEELAKYFKELKELSKKDKGSYFLKIALILNERLVSVEEVPMHAERTIKDMWRKTMHATQKTDGPKPKTFLATEPPAPPKAFGSAPVPELRPILGSKVAFNVRDEDIVDQYPLSPPPIPRKSVLATKAPTPQPFGSAPLPELRPILKDMMERDAERRKTPPPIPEDALPKITDADIVEELPSTPPPIPVEEDQIVSVETIPTAGMGQAPTKLRPILGEMMRRKVQPLPIPEDAKPSVYDIPRGETDNVPKYVSMVDDRMPPVTPPPVPAMADVPKTRKGIFSKIKSWFKNVA